MRQGKGYFQTVSAQIEVKIQVKEASASEAPYQHNTRWSCGTPLFALESNHCNIPVNNESIRTGWVERMRYLAQASNSVCAHHHQIAQEARGIQRTTDLAEKGFRASKDSIGRMDLEVTVKSSHNWHVGRKW